MIVYKGQDSGLESYDSQMLHLELIGKEWCGRCSISRCYQAVWM